MHESENQAVASLLRGIACVVVVALIAMVATVAGCDGRTAGDDPPTLFLTWQHDPTTTMTVQWLDDQSTGGAPKVSFRAEGETHWRTATGARSPFPKSKRSVCRVELTGLTPATDYRFRLADGGVELHFATMPATNDQPITFISGGDASSSRDAVNRNAQAARLEPMFVLLGGDLAYADGQRPGDWVDFLAAWRKNMVTPAGRLVPLVACIGNHEVDDDTKVARSEAPFFYALFGLYDKHGYAVLDFGDYLSLVLLDTFHTTPVEGEQTDWLAQTLAQRGHKRHILAAYHVPAYPTYSPFDHPVSKAIRQQWAPLFERYGVETAFEHHDHTYKRTYPIRSGVVDPAGVVYLGGGAWGKSVRQPRSPKDEWYLARSEAKFHFIAVTIAGDRCLYNMIDAQGNVFDHCQTKLPAAANAPENAPGEPGR